MPHVEEELGTVSARRERRSLVAGQAGPKATARMAHAAREVTGQDIDPVTGRSDRDRKEVQASQHRHDRVIAAAGKRDREEFAASGSGNLSGPAPVSVLPEGAASA